jgi:tetratricopeptide (TPR) repeat protein
MQMSGDEMAADAWAAMGRGETDEALRCWQALREQFPERADGHIRPVQALLQAGRLDEAEDLAGKVDGRFADDPELLVQRSWVAVARLDWPEALHRWSAFSASYPERMDGVAGSSRALRMMGRGADAEALVAKALARHPQAEELLIEYVWTAVARDDWAAAATRLEIARRRLDDPERFETYLGWVAARIPHRRPAPSSAVRRKSRSVTTLEPLDTKELMLAFESLGERCDFGAVQRSFGAEPLGLLRFAFTKFDSLIAALEDRFAAIGTEEDTGFEHYKDENILYMRKYGLIFHTFVYDRDLPTSEKREAFQAKQLQRLVFLKNKLVADLQDPQKIYVYSTDERHSDDDVQWLFSALQTFGPNSLLYVRPSRDDRSSGLVERLEDGLYAGYFPGLADFVGGAQPPFDLWRHLCQQAYRLEHSAS